MCSIKAVAMCLQGKGTFHWNQFLFIALPTFNNFSPIKAGRINEQKIAWTSANVLQIPVHIRSYRWRENKNRQGHMCTFAHTYTHTHFPCPHMCPGYRSPYNYIHKCSGACAKTHSWTHAHIPAMHIFTLAQHTCVTGRSYGENALNSLFA